MIIGLGTDICEVKRFTGKAADDNLVLRLFSSNEIAYSFKYKTPQQHLAARFAAKEAFFKALGTGWRGACAWADVEVVHNSLGKPELKLHNAAAGLLKPDTNVFLSISHSGSWATATVILEQEL